MPLASFSSSDAARNLRRNLTGMWPDGRKRGQRLEGIAQIGVKPTFTFSRDDLIMTIGSCFAREIETALRGMGFTLPTRDLKIPAEERITSTENDILNKYTVQAMVNEIEWAFSPPAFVDTDLFVTAGSGLWHDPHLVHTIKPATLERVAERRAQVLDIMRRLPECRVVVVTFGLAEAWYDQKLGVYLNSMPPQPAIAADPNRFRLDVLSYEDILQGIERLLQLLKQYGHPEHKVLMTVSPVPFVATFTGDDALAANTYSKSVQRAAVEAAVRAHEHVNYFPSYEIVTLTDRKVAFNLDNIHVNPEVVAEIMRRVVTAYVPDVQVEAGISRPEREKSRDSFNYPSVLGVGHAALADRNYSGAAAHFASVLYRFEKTLPPHYLAGAFSGLIQATTMAGLTRESYRHAVRWRKLDPESALASAVISKILIRLEKPEKAIKRAQQACALDPADPKFHMRLASLLVRQGQIEEGREAARRALELDPSLDAARLILEGESRGASKNS